MRKTEARTILEGKLFSELVESYTWMQYEAFMAAPEIKSELWARARAAKELHSFIDNKCREILDE